MEIEENKDTEEEKVYDQKGKENNFVIKRRRIREE